MNQETNSIIQGLIFLFSKYPNGRIEGGRSGETSYIEFQLPKLDSSLLVEDIRYLESFKWEEYFVDTQNSYGQAIFLRVWRFYIQEVEEDNVEK